MSFLSSRPHTKQEIQLLITISQSTVTCTLLSTPKESSHYTKKIYTTSEPFKIPSQENFQTFTPYIDRNLTEALKKIATEGVRHLNFLKINNKHITSIKVVLSTPWTTSKLITAHEKFEKPHYISQKILNDLQKRNIESIEEIDNHSILERKTLHTRLNGYPSIKPIGKTADTIDITFFISYIEKGLTERISNNIEKFFSHTLISFHSRSAEIITSTSGYFENNEHLCIIDVEEYFTSIYSMRHKIIDSIQSFPCGSYSPIENLAHTLQVTTDIAHSYIKLFLSGNAEEAFSRTVEKSLHLLEEEYSVYIENLPQKITQALESYPIITIGDQHVLSFIKKILVQKIHGATFVENTAPTHPGLIDLYTSIK